LEAFLAKVLFINPVIRAEDAPRHVPYGIALLTAICDRLGHQVQVFDANAWRQGDEVLAEVLQADDWEVVATGGITTSYASIKKIVSFARQHAPKALIVLGGGVLTSMPHDIMRFLPAVDLGVVGEGVVTFPELLRKVDERQNDWANLKGIIWRDPSGTCKLSDPRPLLQDLDSLPTPGWEFFPLDIYFKNSSVLLSAEAMQAKRRLDINMSYGCSLVCRFCFHLGLTGEMRYIQDDKGNRDVAFTWDRQLRFHSPDYVVNLVKHARERFGVDFIGMLDENLMTMNTATRGKWLSDICRKWIEAGLQPSCVREGRPHDPASCTGVHWGGTSHAGLVNSEVLKLMHQAGCSHLDYGLESFSPRVLKNIGKGATAESNMRALKMTIEAGIRPIPNQIVGFPDEFFDSLIDSVKAWERAGIVAKPFFATPYPGSEWYATYKDRIIEQYDGDLEAFLLDLGDATTITAVISENFNAVELLGLRELMMNHDIRRIQEYEKVWRRTHGEPKFPKFGRPYPPAAVIKPQSSGDSTGSVL
jgi:radical SAM superfamily enzyme YgiQ (UPF0313 family)